MQHVFQRNKQYLEPFVTDHIKEIFADEKEYKGNICVGSHIIIFFFFP